jgi:hypothetical protein
VYDDDLTFFYFLYHMWRYDHETDEDYEIMQKEETRILDLTREINWNIYLLFVRRMVVIRRSVDYTTSNNEVFLILSHVYKNVLSFV